MKYFHSGNITILVLTTFAISCGAAFGEQDLNVTAKFRALKPLPKVHYSFSLSPNLINNRDSRVLYELARITHSLSLSGPGCTLNQVDNCLYTCARINRTKPKIESSLAINFSPWHWRFGKDLPPTDKGPTYQTEIELFVRRLKLITKWVAASNKKYHSNVKVSAVLLDSERFHVRKDNLLWNEAIRQKLDEIHTLTTAILPKARIEWYGRGILRIWGGDGWDKTRYFTGKEIKAPLSCSLYSVPELQRMRETYRRTCHLADELGIAEVTPWVALGSGFRRGLVKKQYWEMDWPYDLIYSHQIGSELNVSWYAENPKRFAPYDRATVVVFYPAPFDRRVPSWAKHFIAYVRGATGMNELSDLGWSEPKDSVTITP